MKLNKLFVFFILFHSIIFAVGPDLYHTPKPTNSSLKTKFLDYCRPECPICMDVFWRFDMVYMDCCNTNYVLCISCMKKILDKAVGNSFSCPFCNTQNKKSEFEFVYMY